MSEGKWLVDFKAVSENFLNAVDVYQTNVLLGIVYGISTTKQVTNVVFVQVPKDSEELKSKADNILFLMSPEIDSLGLARITDNPTNSLSFYADEKLSLKFSVEHLTNVLRNLRKITDNNCSVVNYSNLLFREISSRFVRILFDTHFQLVDTGSVDIPSFKLKFNEEDADINDFDMLIKKSTKLDNLSICLADTTEIVVKLLDTNISDNFAAKPVKLTVDVVLSVGSLLTSTEFKDRLKVLMARIFSQAQNILLKEGAGVTNFVVRTFAPPGALTLIHLVSSVCDKEEKYRRDAHNTLNLTHKLPIFLERQSVLTVLKSNYLRLFNPHEFIKYTPFKGGICAVVRGRYEYYHYLQDNFDDNGWGCAYRSFQTVWSWFYHQNFTTQLAPTHKKIQQCLVDINDKKPNFVGSKNWIGSLELSFCLENMINILSRILPVESSNAFIDHARAIIYHFENYGAPIMIGGGQYAYTILGIDYDFRLGKCQFLVLDPHYTGAEDIMTIIKNGWCAWKPSSFWTKKCFFNMLMPITPTISDENL